MSGSVGLAGKVDAAEIRRRFIQIELLKPPLSLREPDDRTL